MNTLNPQDSAASLVSSRPRILRYLREIHTDNLTLSLSLADDGLERVFQTRILRIEDQRILLHQLMPGNWRELVRHNAEVIVSCPLSGGQIRFAARLRPLDDGLSYCLLTLPEKLDRRQQRSFFRVSLLKYGAGFSARLANGDAFSGRVGDLSRGGLLCLVGEHEARADQGEVLEECRLEIPGILDITFRAMICHTVDNKGTGVINMGLKFLELTAAESAAVRRAISRVERENIRHRAAS